MLEKNETVSYTIEPPKSTLQILLKINFVFVTWFIVAFLVYWGFVNLSTPLAEFEAKYGSFRSTKNILGPLFLLIIHLIIWYVALRKDDAAAKIFSVFEAIAILVIAVIIPLLRSDLSDREINGSFVYGGLYISFSYLAYAIFYKMGGTKTTITYSSQNWHD